jgi:hypothetical protein
MAAASSAKEVTTAIERCARRDLQTIMHAAAPLSGMTIGSTSSRFTIPPSS